MIKINGLSDVTSEDIFKLTWLLMNLYAILYNMKRKIDEFERISYKTVAGRYEKNLESP